MSNKLVKNNAKEQSKAILEAKNRKKKIGIALAVVLLVCVGICSSFFQGQCSNWRTCKFWKYQPEYKPRYKPKCESKYKSKHEQRNLHARSVG